MRHDLGDGYELDDDRARLDLDAVHRYLSGESYWAAGRSLDVLRDVVDNSHRILGLYHRGAQVGFCRVVSDGAVVAYLADGYILPAHRGRGLGVALVRQAVVSGPPVRRWMLHTRDAHRLYARFGFAAAPSQYMEVTSADLRDPLAEELQLALEVPPADE
jgi:GNAT superfamily N-acetyltransferase